MLAAAHASLLAVEALLHAGARLAAVDIFGRRCSMVNLALSSHAVTFSSVLCTAQQLLLGGGIGTMLINCKRGKVMQHRSLLR
jgi:hypothetical protein